jgi:hypothetical protein
MRPLVLLLLAALPAFADTTPLGIEHGTLDFDTPDFNLRLVRDSQTIAALQPKLAPSEGVVPFDFTPADQLQVRSGNRFNHLGDIILRVRQGDTQPWATYASSVARAPVTAIPVPPGTFASADLTPTMGSACPIKVVRTWRLDPTHHLVLHFDLTNTSTNAVTIGALDFPVVFNNMIQDFRINRPRTLAEAHAVCSFSDPYIGQDAGYLQVTRLSGSGPALVVVPEDRTSTPFEAFRPLHDASPRGQTFEGAMAWTARSLAYSQGEWKGVNEWNPPTSETLQPGQTISHGLRFLVAHTIRDIDKTLAAANRPVVIGVPGYILPTDIKATLFIKSGARSIVAVTSEPAGALTISHQPYIGTGWMPYSVQGVQWGRARLAILYGDGTRQTVSYYVTKPAATAVDDLGRFLFSRQWFLDPSDPFGRSPSIITYDRAHDRQVTQDTRAWFAGLSDEAGAGSWLAAAMKEFGRPDPVEVDKLSQFVDHVVWGHIQYSDGPHKYGVRKSLFFYQPDAVPGYQYMPGNWTSWTSWNKAASEDIGRGYNYPHVVAAYWSMYQLARNHPGLVTSHPWDWYLDHAFQTVKFLTGGFATPDGQNRVGYLDTGLMEGDIFLLLLRDLRAEGWTQQADYLQSAMKDRADEWRRRQYPFGSEMAWDSTGQEEVYAWTHYFAFDDKADVTLSAILGYMPTIPSWAYNGNARRYWDFIYGAAPGQGIERMIHHYGSGINSIPVLTQYRTHPDDFYLLRVGYGGSSGALSSIDQDGFAACAFHSDPARLRWDTYSGDYGVNFFGHALTAACYIVDHPDFGWLAFGGNLHTAPDGTITVQPLDSFHKRLYIAPCGLYLTLDAGTFENVSINPATHAVSITLSPADPYTPVARLRIDQPAKLEGIAPFLPPAKLAQERGATVIPLGVNPVSITLQPGK